MSRRYRTPSASLGKTILFVNYVPGSVFAASISLGGLGRFLIDGLSVSDYTQMAGGAVLVALVALLVDGILSLVQRTVVSPEYPGLTGRFRKQQDSRPVVSTTARGDASDPASPTDRADDQREALV